VIGTVVGLTLASVLQERNPAATFLKDNQPCTTVNTKTSIGADAVDDRAVNSGSKQVLEKKKTQANEDMLIPRILHHIYLDGRPSFDLETKAPDASIASDWSRSCVAMHPNWEYRFWDEQDVQRLIREKYPWILHSYVNETKDCTVNGADCNPMVLRADIARVLVLHAEGGMYLDMDVECWQPADKMLRGATVVLQATAVFEGVTNAIMAGVKGHKLWLTALEMMKERVSDATKLVFDRTGPNLVADAAKRIGAVHESSKDGENVFLGDHILENGDIVRAYPMGEFFTPCWAFDRPCFAQAVLERGLGLLPERWV